MKYTLFLTLSVVLALAFAVPTQDAKVEQGTQGKEEVKETAEKHDQQEQVLTKEGENHEHHHEQHDSSTTETHTDSTTEKGVTEKDDDDCVPGTTFARDCNMCTCTDTGKRSLSACTLKLCSTVEEVKTAEEEVKAVKEEVKEATKTE